MSHLKKLMILKVKLTPRGQSKKQEMSLQVGSLIFGWENIKVDLQGRSMFRWKSRAR